MIQRPKALICYICGREYGTHSLEIHLKTCKKKWAKEQEELPVKKRRPCPKTPPGFTNMVRVAQGKKPLEDLPTNLDDKPIGSLNPGEAIQAYNEAAYANWDQEVLEPCESCGRTFRPAALEIHKKSCKPGKPLKRPIVS